jgi:hypothetical protein
MPDGFGDLCFMCGNTLDEEEWLVPAILFLLGQEGETADTLHAVAICPECMTERFDERIVGCKVDPEAVPAEVRAMSADLEKTTEEE